MAWKLQCGIRCNSAKSQKEWCFFHEDANSLLILWSVADTATDREYHDWTYSLPSVRSPRSRCTLLDRWWGPDICTISCLGRPTFDLHRGITYWSGLISVRSRSTPVISAKSGSHFTNALQSSWSKSCEEYKIMIDQHATTTVKLSWYVKLCDLSW